MNRPNGTSPHHFVYVGAEREKIHDPAFLSTKAFDGAQVRYTWRMLEPKENVYDFSPIQEDLDFLKAHGKRLFVQLADATFSAEFKCVPRYLLDDPRFHGGMDKQSEGDRVLGWVARRWDKAVRERYQSLLRKLGKAFDGKLEGINLPETSVDIPESGPLRPKDFTETGYRDALLDNMAALKRAFPRSVTIQYANFMPGEWLPGDNKGYLRSIYTGAAKLGVGVGGPDLLPYRPGQMAHSYPLIAQAPGRIPKGIAVQDGNYSSVNPKTGKAYSLDELLHFATNYLKVDYIFWCTEEPYYSTQLIPFLKKR
ncbi:MAG: hypothetical protein QM758_18275 [Armatimonas sp.]